MTPQPTSHRWIRDYMRKLDHKIEMNNIRAKTRKLRELQTDNHRLEEQARIDSARDRMRNANRTNADRERWLRIVSSDLVLPGTESRVTQWRAHVEQLLATHGITATYGVLAQQNGYAWAVSRAIDISPINNAFAYVTALHEIGHCAQPCRDHTREAIRKHQDDHWARFKKLPPRREGGCVPCELSAWRFAMDAALPTWERRMHDEMARCLRTYARDATDAHKQEIDAMVSTSTYCDTRLRRATRSTR